MREAVFYILSSFWAGAVHAATPGHGKTIAAAYIVGARGRPIDAVILGVFVTLSHVSGIVLVGVLASLGSAWLVPQRIEAWLGLALGVLVIGLGAWMLWLQREVLAVAMGEPAAVPAPQAASAGPAYHETGAGHDHARPHGHGQAHLHRHDFAAPHQHGPDDEAGWHSHGWGTYHSHRLDLVTDQRPKLAVLLALGIAGGILPDPAALAILLAALSSGKVMLGLATVVVFSLGFASTLVIVGIIAAKVGQKVLDWLSSIWVARVQIATTLLILGMGVVLTVRACYQLAALPG
jgi:nickel/cobalt transporter (NicO) family protein